MKTNMSQIIVVHYLQSHFMFKSSNETKLVMIVKMILDHPAASFLQMYFAIDNIVCYLLFAAHILHLFQSVPDGK